jgi:SSS family solute:Na+ symporter
MSPRTTALAIIFAIVFAGSLIGFLAAKKKRPNLEEWAVAGRGFGLLFVWILLAGETFTAFSVLGVSGWTYAKGGPVLYVLAYLTIGQLLVFYIGPPMWEAGRRYRLQTISDFFGRRYGSDLLAAAVAVAGVLFLILYLQLQITSLGIIVGFASLEAIGRTPAMVAATILVASFVLVSGVRGVAWVSVLKDFLLVALAVVVGFGIPYLRFGGLGPMYSEVNRTHPGFLTLPGATTNYGHLWYVTTVLVNALVFAWPHFYGALFTAKDADTVRRNAILMPLYVIPLALIMFAGTAAILLVPGLKNGDLALLAVVREVFPPWVLGLIGGAGALTAMVPASIHILTASTLFTKNVYRPYVDPGMSDARMVLLARFLVFVVAAVALYLALHSSTTLVGLLMLAYSGVGQFAPGLVLGIYCPRINAAGVLAGLAAGLGVTGVLVFAHLDPWHGLNAGFVGLSVNVPLTVLVSLLTPARPSGILWEPAPPAGAGSGR